MNKVIHGNFSFAYQPILKANRNQTGVAVLLRPSAARTTAPSPTAGVIVDAFIHARMDRLFGKHRLFFKVDGDFLLSDVALALPRGMMVLELPGDIATEDKIVTRCQQLQSLGHKIALDDFALEENHAGLLGVADYVKVALDQIDHERLRGMMPALRRWSAEPIATGVNSLAEVEIAIRSGFGLFQGYHFAQPATISGRRLDPGRTALLALLGDLNRDAGDRVIEETFQRNPALTFHILRLVNSPALGLTGKIGSIRQALAILGRRQLMRWLQLLLFAVGDPGEPSPLTELAAKRGKLMELLIQYTSHQLGIFQERAYMVGVLSLVDVLLETPMAEVVTHLNLVEEVADALLERKGKLGTMLALCEQLEAADFDAAANTAAKLQIPYTNVMRSQFHAAAWVSKLGQDSNSSEKTEPSEEAEAVMSLNQMSLETQ